MEIAAMQTRGGEGGLLQFMNYASDMHEAMKHAPRCPRCGMGAGGVSWQQPVERAAPFPVHQAPAPPSPGALQGAGLGRRRHFQCGLRCCHIRRWPLGARGGDTGCTGPGASGSSAARRAQPGGAPGGGCGRPRSAQAAQRARDRLQRAAARVGPGTGSDPGCSPLRRLQRIRDRGLLVSSSLGSFSISSSELALLSRARGACRMWGALPTGADGQRVPDPTSTGAAARRTCLARWF
ncbi:hypothetical protein KIL84_008718 [Mauremys mutica]|uniref:Uncharacterized protein n=1 Tax=Mauremys mutica TaxID=74926 RepID=A0A9D3X753_9SAUR|nr:hypothetical protein KIL84_008718 [Mauremys mutica]